MSARNHTFCLSLVAILLATGCSKIESTQLGDGDTRWGGYARNKTYVIQSDVFLLKLSEAVGGAPVEFSLTPEASFREWSSVYGAPDSVRKYLEDGDTDVSPTTGARYQGKSTVRGVVRAGTKLVVREAVDYYFWNWFFGGAFRTVVYADILDGEFGGLRVDIQDMSNAVRVDSQEAGGRKVLRPDENLLAELVAQTAK